MISDIEAAIPEAWQTVSGGGPVAWMGAFTRTGVLISVSGCTAELSLFFKLEEQGRLRWVQSKTLLVSSCAF